MSQRHHRVGSLVALGVAILLLGMPDASEAGTAYDINGADVPIPHSGEWATSTITISGFPDDATIVFEGVDVYYSIVHSYGPDLIVDVDYDNGVVSRSYRLWDSEAGSNPSELESGIGTFDGLSPNGTWKLRAVDHFPVGSGDQYIDEWWIRIRYSCISSCPLLFEAMIDSVRILAGCPGRYSHLCLLCVCD